jgi:hypothetical protein
LPASGIRILSSSSSDKQDIPWLRNARPEGGGNYKPPKPRRNRNLINALIIVVILLCAFGGFFGLALYRAGGISTPPQVMAQTTSTATLISCQELIERAMQASDDSCNRMDSNQVCYGNNTLSAELQSGVGSLFNQRGDVVNVTDLKRLAASPLSLVNNEWGIAVFKVMANLPRSLPGENVTMVVFGNTTLDNASNNLQTFYFYSNLGQIDCEQVPFDGLMINMPSGSGVKFVINGAEMTLMGDASLKATKNGNMEVSMYSGSALISSNGGSQVVAAGQQTSMNLGGPDGASAVSPPSPPVPLSAAELALACTLTGQFCSQGQITPVSIFDSLATLQAGLGLIPTGESTATGLPSPTTTPISSFTATLSQTRTKTPTLPPGVTPSATPFVTSTNTPLGVTPSNTSLAPTNTSVPATNTPLPPTNTSVPPTNTSVPPTPTSVPMITICHCTAPGNCQQLSIQNTGHGGHFNHPLDLIPAPAEGCPVPTP